MLAAYVQCLSARHQHSKTAALAKEVHQGGCGSCDLLEVVKDQQDVLVPHPTLDVFKQRRVGSFADTNGSGGHGEQRLRVPDRRQVDKEDAVFKLVDLFSSSAQCQAAFRKRSQSWLLPSRSVKGRSTSRRPVHDARPPTISPPPNTSDSSLSRYERADAAAESPHDQPSRGDGQTGSG